MLSLNDLKPSRSFYSFDGMNGKLLFFAHIPNSCKFAEWQNIIKQAIRVGIHVSSIYNNHSFSIMCTIWLDLSFVYPKATPVMKFLAWLWKKIVSHIFFPPLKSKIQSLCLKAVSAQVIMMQELTTCKILRFYYA